MTIVKHSFAGLGSLSLAVAILLSGCAPVKVPDARNTQIPTPAAAAERQPAINERPDSVMYLPLGDDVLVPEIMDDDPLPSESVGPFELRGETLAGALQLILAEYDVALAFESDLAFSRYVTVSNLHGPLDKVVRRVCSLANLYCSYEEGTLVVKDTQTFTITIPPIGGNSGTGADSAANTDNSGFVTSVASGLAAVLGTGGAAPIVDQSTRTIIYTATQRTAELASRYFQRLRANTAMIVFETYIWEVNLNAGNSTGIDWDQIDTFGKFNVSVGVAGDVSGDFVNPVSIGLPTTKNIGTTPADIVRFLSQFGAVKSISQPQITVLSGSTAQLRVAETENYVSEISTTFSENQSTTAVDTDSVDSGFTLTIGSTWDKATVYANIGIELTNVLEIRNFAFSDGGDEGTKTSIQLPQTTERELSTQVRIRPGDSVLIAGLVQESDNFDTRGPGFMEPILPDSRTAKTDNLELVFLLRPRVVVYTTPDHVAHEQAVKSSAAVTAAGPTGTYKAAPRQGALSSSMSSDPIDVPASQVPSAPAPAPAPVMAMPFAPAPLPAPVSAPAYVPPVVEPVSMPPARVSGSTGDTYTPSFGSGARSSARGAATAGSTPSAAPAAVQAPYDTRGTNSGYVSKYLGGSSSSGASAPANPGAVEIFDPENAAGAIDGASQPVPLSGYSTYGAGGY